MNWERFFKYACDAYFTTVIMQFISLITILTYFIVPGKTKPTRYLALISLASFIEVSLAAFYLSKNLGITLGKYFDQKLLYIYLITETLCCSLYIRDNIQSPPGKKLILASAAIFASYVILFWLFHFTKLVPLHIEIVEGFLIIAYCLYFFYESLTAKSDKTLFKHPGFWAISGMFVLFSAITPFFLFFDYLRKNNSSFAHSLYAINNIFYSLLFITFTTTILFDRKLVCPGFETKKI